MTRLLFTLLCSLLCACAPVGSVLPDAGPTGIGGTVEDGRGRPAGGAYVYAYRSAGTGLRGPADFEALVGEEGRYFLDLVDGCYYLVARTRGEGAASGPPRAGDAWTVYPSNPVEVREGRTARADFVLRAGLSAMPMRGGPVSGNTGFTGRIIDAEGRPVEGTFALAYKDRDYRRMPDFASSPAGEDGTFTLHLPGGTYCLAARTKTRGQPTAGEPYGLLGECRTLEEGEILDVGEIVVRPFRR